MEGLTGNTLDSHRLIAAAGQQGPQIQDALVEELFSNYFTQVRSRAPVAVSFCQEACWTCVYDAVTLKLSAAVHAAECVPGQLHVWHDCQLAQNVLLGAASLSVLDLPLSAT